MNDKLYTYCIHYHFVNHYTNGTDWHSGDLCISCKAHSKIDAQNIFNNTYKSNANRTYYMDSCWFCG